MANDRPMHVARMKMDFTVDSSSGDGVEQGSEGDQTEGQAAAKAMPGRLGTRNTAAASLPG